MQAFLPTCLQFLNKFNLLWKCHDYKDKFNCNIFMTIPEFLTLWDMIPRGTGHSLLENIVAATSISFCQTKISWFYLGILFSACFTNYTFLCFKS